MPLFWKKGLAIAAAFARACVSRGTQPGASLWNAEPPFGTLGVGLLGVEPTGDVG